MGSIRVPIIGPIWGTHPIPYILYLGICAPTFVPQHLALIPTWHHLPLDVSPVQRPLDPHIPHPVPRGPNTCLPYQGPISHIPHVGPILRVVFVPQHLGYHIPR